MEHSLTVTYKSEEVFTSDAHWLHPLFELDEFIKRSMLPAAELFVRDKVAGRAAAAMIVRMGIRRCHIELVSRKAVSVFEREGVEFTYDTLVETIECQTEMLITESMSIEEVWLFLRKRDGRVEGLPLEIKDLCVTLGGKPVLQDFNLSLSSGEPVVLYGSNGIGKTTLLKTILGLVKPVSGYVKIGENVAGTAAWRRRRYETAYMHQESVRNTFPATAGEVVGMGMAGRALPAAERSYNIELAMRRMACFNLFARPYFSLSGGEKQRVSLARCLCQKARVLLLDEPTSSLDATARSLLRELLMELCRKEAPTIVLVTHEEEWARMLSWRTVNMPLPCGAFAQ
jgi:zinc transport system ATP-binding protein